MGTEKNMTEIPTFIQFLTNPSHRHKFIPNFRIKFQNYEIFFSLFAASQWLISLKFVTRTFVCVLFTPTWINHNTHKKLTRDHKYSMFINISMWLCHFIVIMWWYYKLLILRREMPGASRIFYTWPPLDGVSLYLWRSSKFGTPYSELPQTCKTWRTCKKPLLDQKT